MDERTPDSRRIGGFLTQNFKNMKTLSLDSFEKLQIEDANPLIGGQDDCCGTTTIRETVKYRTIDIILGGGPTGTDETGSWDDEGCC